MQGVSPHWPASVMMSWTAVQFSAFPPFGCPWTMVLCYPPRPMMTIPIPSWPNTFSSLWQRRSPYRDISIVSLLLVWKAFYSEISFTNIVIQRSAGLIPPLASLGAIIEMKISTIVSLSSIWFPLDVFWCDPPRRPGQQCSVCLPPNPWSRIDQNVESTVQVKVKVEK